MDIMERIEQQLDGLAKSEAKVGRLILTYPNAVADFSITRLAQEADTSTSAVQRFCQSLGYTGYKDFRYDLAAEAARVPRTETDDPLGDAAKRLASAVSALAQLNRAVLEELVGDIAAASRVLCVGVHRSSLPAAKLRMDLEDLGICALGANDPVGASHLARLMVDDACAVVFSVAGASNPLLFGDAETSGHTWMVTTNARAKAPDAATRLIVLPSASFPGAVHVDDHAVMMAFVELLVLLVRERKDPGGVQG